MILTNCMKDWLLTEFLKFILIYGGTTKKFFYFYGVCHFETHFYNNFACLQNKISARNVSVSQQYSKPTFLSTRARHPAELPVFDSLLATAPGAEMSKFSLTFGFQCIGPLSCSIDNTLRVRFKPSEMWPKQNGHNFKKSSKSIFK